MYDFNKIKTLIDRKEFAGKDPFGIPILDMKKALYGQVQLGLGPLHTQFDSQDGIVYTSLYVDSAVVKWDYKKLKVLDKLQVHYNIGHLVAPHGDTIKPHGKYVIALNKLAVDRFNPIGPLHPPTKITIASFTEEKRSHILSISGLLFSFSKSVPLSLIFNYNTFL